LRRLILPPSQVFLGCHAQQLRACEDLDVLHAARLVDQCIQFDIAGQAICSRNLRVAWQHRVNQARRLNLAAYRERSVGRAGHGWAWQILQWRIDGRSEERRVGKECRSGWAREQEKKKRHEVRTRTFM